MINKGDFVIINDTDCPEVNCIVRLTSIRKLNDGRYKFQGRYISEHMAKKYGRKKYCFAIRDKRNPITPTLVADFGIDLEVACFYMDIDNHSIRACLTRDSSATYLDGSPRKWQDAMDKDSCISKQLRTDYLDLFDFFGMGV